jgi:hypothetical protein
VPERTADVPVPALMVLLGVGKQDHENQSRCDTSGYDVLRHGRRSVVVDGDDEGLEAKTIDLSQCLDQPIASLVTGRSAPA